MSDCTVSKIDDASANIMQINSVINNQRLNTRPSSLQTFPHKVHVVKVQKDTEIMRNMEDKDLWFGKLSMRVSH